MKRPKIVGKEDSNFGILCGRESLNYVLNSRAIVAFKVDTKEWMYISLKAKRLYRSVTPRLIVKVLKAMRNMGG